MPVVALAPEMLWASIELMKNMVMGHEVDSLGQFFASLTVHDCSALSLVIDEATALGLEYCRGSVQLVTMVPKGVQGADQQSKISEFWDMETGTASISITFDCISSRRRDIIANARHAFMFGVHPEEFQARCASRELALPFAEEDAVALYIYTTIGEQFRREASSEHFLRLFVGGKGCGTAVLFSGRRLVAWDAFGRISEVRLLLRIDANGFLYLRAESNKFSILWLSCARISCSEFKQSMRMIAACSLHHQRASCKPSFETRLCFLTPLAPIPVF